MTTIADLMAIQKRANGYVMRRSGGELSAEEKANFIAALNLVAEGKSVQGAAEELGVNRYTLYAFVKGKKKLDLLVG